MKVYNTLTRKKEPLPSPEEPRQLNMFVCGPTVYDHIHIGNARTFVFFDVVAKYLKYRGYNVRYIQNITDIDNKIIERAEKEGIDSLEYAKKYSDIFKQDMEALGVTSPEYKNATDHIPEVIKQVQTLLNKGNAYVIDNDGIYFDLATFPDYGKLSGRTAGMADDAVSRIDDSDKKRNRGDFAIWKFSKEGEPAWSLETGEYMGIMDSADPAFAKASAGRPGWHIEDTAITEKYFGPQYDIHGGGQDLIFPHHEAEIAQQESASSLKPFVKYWLHAGFLVNKKTKMSKSKKNFATARELIEKYPPEALRLYFLSAHYRSPLSFEDKLIDQSQSATNKIADFVYKLQRANGQHNDNADVAIQSASDDFIQAMDDDFNTPQALAVIFSLVRELNLDLSNGNISKQQADKIMDFFVIARKVLGVIPETQEQIIPPEIEMLMEQRNKYRENKEWDKADTARAEIETKGYQIDDTPYGPLVKKK